MLPWQPLDHLHIMRHPRLIPSYVTAEGAVMYALSSGEFFDPTELAEAVTPQAARQALSQRQYVKALLLAMRLKDTDMLENILFSVPDEQVRQPTRI